MVRSILEVKSKAFCRSKCNTSSIRLCLKPFKSFKGFRSHKDYIKLNMWMLWSSNVRRSCWVFFLQCFSWRTRSNWCWLSASLLLYETIDFCSINSYLYSHDRLHCSFFNRVLQEYWTLLKLKHLKWYLCTLKLTYFAG